MTNYNMNPVENIQVALHLYFLIKWFLENYRTILSNVYQIKITCINPVSEFNEFEPRL